MFADANASFPTPENVNGRRVAAALIDLLLLAIAFFVFVSLWGESQTRNGQFSFNLGGLSALAYFLFAFGYYFALEALTRKTLGKWIMGLEVQTVDGAPYGAGKAFLRNILSDHRWAAISLSRRLCLHPRWPHASAYRRYSRGHHRRPLLVSGRCPRPAPVLVSPPSSLV
jgi:uncharacterized RDD family membrane protein YckC